MAAASGLYVDSDGQYVYLYDASSGSITIIVSPRSLKQTKVKAGTAAYTAILSGIQAGTIKTATTAQVQAAQRTAGAALSTQFKPSSKSGGSTALTTTDPTAPPATGGGIKPYVPVIIIGGVGLVLFLGVLMWPKGRKAAFAASERAGDAMRSGISRGMTSAGRALA